VNLNDSKAMVLKNCKQIMTDMLRIKAEAREKIWKTRSCKAGHIVDDKYAAPNKEIRRYLEE
jgi:hypothetical protein